MSTRADRKEQTRVALGDAAVRLFVDQGFDRTTVEDIAAAAGVSRRTFFRYFPTKEAAFFATHDDRFADFVALVARGQQRWGVWGACREAFLEVAKRYEADRARSIAWRQVLTATPELQAHDLRLDAQWEGEVRDRFLGEGMSPLRAAVQAGVMMGAVRAVLDQWYREEGDLVAMGREAFGWLDEVGRATD